jgi:hypothetical protein
VKSYSGSPMTLGNAVSALVRLIVWCRACQHQVEPDPALPRAQPRGDATACADDPGQEQEVNFVPSLAWPLEVGSGPSQTRARPAGPAAPPP